MKRMFVALLFFCLFTPCLFAAESSFPYCRSIAVDLGDGEIIDTVDDLPAYFVFHLQMYDDNTYEGLYFGAKTSGVWTQKDGEGFILTVDETLDGDLRKRHDPGKPAFLFSRDAGGNMTLVESNNPTIVYLEDAEEEYDEDAILERMMDIMMEL